VTTARGARGKRAEDAVVDYLETRGFEVLGRNVRLGPLEIDLVARKGALAVVVEVRTRGGGAWERALESVGAKKRASIVRATQRLWRAKLAGMTGVERVRIDVAAVTFDGGATRVEYIEAALTA
jgi:putative endonuclease